MALVRVIRKMTGESDIVVFEEEVDLSADKEVTIVVTKNFPVVPGEKVTIEVDEPCYAEVEFQLVKEKIHT